MGGGVGQRFLGDEFGDCCNCHGNSKGGFGGWTGRELGWLLHLSPGFKQREIEAIVRFAKERLRPAITALGHMVQGVGQNNASKAGHRMWICQEQCVVNGGACQFRSAN